MQQLEPQVLSSGTSGLQSRLWGSLEGVATWSELPCWKSRVHNH